MLQIVDHGVLRFDGVVDVKRRWCSLSYMRVVGVDGIQLPPQVNGSLAFLSPIVFGTLGKTQIAFDLVLLGLVCGFLDTDRAFAQLKKPAPYLGGFAVTVIILGGVLSVIAPGQSDEAVSESMAEAREAMRVSGVILLMAGLSCRGMAWAAKSHLISTVKRPYVLEVQVASMSIMQFFMGVVFCVVIYGVGGGLVGIVLSFF